MNADLRKQIRVHWKQRWERGDTTARAVAATDIYFDLLKDPVFVEAFVKEIAEIGETMQYHRHYERGSGTTAAANGDRTMSREQVLAEVAVEETPWAAWIHRDARTGSQIPLLAMSKHDLLTAAEERRKRGDVAYKDAAFYDALAQPMSDGDLVEDVWRAEDISALYQRLSLKVKVDVKLLTEPTPLRGIA